MSDESPNPDPSDNNSKATSRSELLVDVARRIARLVVRAHRRGLFKSPPSAPSVKPPTSSD